MDTGVEDLAQPIRHRRKIDAIKALLRITSLRDYCLFVLAINSGLRISDLLHLTVGDVINGTGVPGDRITVGEQKTGKKRYFPISDTAIEALREYLSTRTGANPAEPLFPSTRTGKAVSRQQACHVITDAAYPVMGYDYYIGTHTLRKTFGYHAYKQGIGIAWIQKLMNHSAPSITLEYIGITKDELDDVYLNLNL